MKNLTTINLYGIEVRIDSEGRYCLNDLHKAAVANEKATANHAPAQFLRNASVKAFTQRLSDVQNCTSVVSIRGGKNQGTYGHDLVVARYAAWIDVDFEIDVYETFQQAKRQQAMAAEGSSYALALLVRPEAADWQRRFSEDYYRALARVTNTRHMPGHAGRPSLWGQITRRWIYSAIMPPEVLAELDARRQDGEKLHQWLTEGGAEAIQRQVQAITTIANASLDYADFKARCQQVYGNGQLYLVYPAAA